MTQFYIEKSGRNNWIVKATAFGCNSRIVDSYPTERQARACVDRLNKVDASLSFHPITLDKSVKL